MKSGATIHISGIVQGVGFRPFVYNLASRFGLTGWVRNTSAGVDIEVDGPARVLQLSSRPCATRLPRLRASMNLSPPMARSNGFADL